MRPGLNAFGQPVVAVADMVLADRVDVARRLAGRLQASTDPVDRWLGAGLGTWFTEGGDLGAILGIRGAPGLVRAERIATLRQRLVVAARGSVTSAARALRDDPPAPALRDLVLELRRLGAATSRRAFYRGVRATRGPRDGTF